MLAGASVIGKSVKSRRREKLRNREGDEESR